MKTDKIFYTLFQVFPELLFQLLEQPTELAQNYQFQSVEIKELAFRLDGIFVPDTKELKHPIYFLEVQFQKDPDFYWRFFTEIFLYLNQYKPLRPWYAIVLWAKHSFDDGLPLPYQQLLVNQHLQRIYLDRLTPQASNSLGLQIVQFIVASEPQAAQQVPSLLNQAKQQVSDATIQQNIVELIEKIIVYKFPEKSRQELEAMFNLTAWKQTRFYQEAKEEGKLEGKLEGEQEGKLKTVPIFLKLGLTPEQIAEELKLSIEKIRQFISSQNN
jgi:predicted transposase/invertase (TIGR01784 family)